MSKSWRSPGGILVLVGLCLILGGLKLLLVPGIPWSMVLAPLWIPFMVFTIAAIIMLNREVKKVKREHRKKQ